MATIYRIRKNVDFVSLELVNESDYDYLLDNIHVGLSAIPFERHICVKYGYETNALDLREKDDFPCISAVFPAFNTRAINALGKILAEFGELLPIYAEEETFYLYNVTHFVDLIDKEQSFLEYCEDILIGIKHLVLKPYSNDSAEVFKLLGDSRGAIYANDAFKIAVEASGIRGIRFEPIKVQKLTS